MTIEEYLRGSLAPFGIDESLFMDIILDSGVNISDDYDAEAQERVGKALVSAIERLLFMPRRTSISENGFSESWNFDNLGKYYMWLCRKWGVTPDKDTVAALGLSVITDRTSSW